MQVGLGKISVLGRELPSLTLSNRALAIARGSDRIAIIPFRYKEGIYVYDRGHWIVSSIEELDGKGLFPQYAESMLQADLNEVKEGLSELLEDAPILDDLEGFLEELRRSTEPKKLEVDENTTLTILDEASTDIVRIHPAVGIVELARPGVGYERKAYVGVWKDVIKEKRKVRKNGSEEVKRIFEKVLFLVLEDGSEILGRDEYLFDNFGIHLSYKPVLLQSGWSGILLERSPPTIYLQLIGLLKEYIELKHDEFYDVVALWAIGTYFFHLFPAYPYLDLNGPKQSGKTKLLTILSLICFNAVYTSNMSIAALYRIVQNMRATVLLDEAESLTRSNERSREIMSLLLQGYKSGAVVYRAEKNKNDTFIPQGFEVYSPKALAHISAINDVLLDRTIPITTIRTLNPKISAREVDSSDVRWKEMKNSLYTFYLKHWREVKEISDELTSVDGLGGDQESLAIKVLRTRGREWELWRPLFVLAKLFERYGIEGLVQRVLRAAEIILRHKLTLEDTESDDMLLIRTLLRMIDERGEGFVPVREITERVKDILEEEGEDPSKINSRKIGRILGKLGLEKRRVNGRSEWKLTRAVIEDLARRAGILDPDSGINATDGGSPPSNAPSDATADNLQSESSGHKSDDSTVFESYSDDRTIMREEGLLSKSNNYGDPDTSGIVASDGIPWEVEYNGDLECPLCGARFHDPRDMKSHIEEVHGKFNPLITALDLWITDESDVSRAHKLETLARRKGIERPTLGDIDQLRIMLESSKQKNDLQGWLNFVSSWRDE